MSVDRMLRLNSLIQRELGHLFEVHIAPILKDSLLTINGVEVATNLRQATVFFSVYPHSEEAAENAQELLQRKRVLLQSMLADKIVLKYTPVLRFKYDKTPEKADRIMEILAELDIEDEVRE